MNSTPKKPNIVYLSTTSRGRVLFGWLRTLPCNILLQSTNGERVSRFPSAYDFGISFMYTFKIPATEFEKGRCWINFHPGPLPEFRGRNLAYHAIMSQSDHFGATIHYMDKDFDTGDIIDVVRFPIQARDTAGDLVNKSHIVLEQLFRRYVPDLLGGRDFNGNAQASGTYYKKTEIDNVISLTDEQQYKIRAVTVAPNYYARVIIGGKEYTIMPVEERDRT